MLFNWVKDIILDFRRDLSGKNPPVGLISHQCLNLLSVLYYIIYMQQKVNVIFFLNVNSLNGYFSVSSYKCGVK